MFQCLYLFPVPFLGLIYLLLFVLSHFNTFVFVLSYYILCYYFPLEFCLFSNKRQKVDGSAWVEENSEEQRSGKP